MKTVYTLVVCLILLFFIPDSFSQTYIDYQVRCDDVYADVTGEAFNEEIVWKFKAKVSSSSATGSYSSVRTYTDTEEYSSGRWDGRSTYTLKSGKCLDNADNVYVFIEAWEEDGGNTTMNSGDDDYRSDTDYDSDISGNPRNAWTEFNSNDEISSNNGIATAGTVGASNGDYRVVIDVWWNYTLPVASCNLTNTTYSSFDIAMSSGYYRVTSWFYQVSTNSSFTNIVSSGTISNGSTSHSVNGLNPNTLYYARVRPTNERGTGSYSSYKTTTTLDDQTTWNGSSWDNGAPDSGMDAIINGTYNISTTIDCDDLIINNGEQLNLLAANTLTVHGNLTNNGMLSLAASASLITYGNITNNGNINIAHSMLDGDWHFLSSPVENATAAIFIGDYLQYYDETLSEENYVDIADENTELSACKGFSWRNNNKGEFTFTGTPHTGNQSIATSADNAWGWNLVGNPYPSSIDWNLLDNDYGTIYIWKGTATGFSSYNNGASTNDGTRYIAPMQGFLISTSGAGSFSVSNSDRTHEGADGYEKSAEELQNYLILEALNGDYRDEVFMQFNDSYLEGFDQLHDGFKMDAMNPAKASLYTKTIDGNLSIDRRPDCESLQLGFNCESNTRATINIIEKSDIENIQIEDTKLNTFHDLSIGAYEFDWLMSDSDDRFILHFKATGSEEMEHQDIQVYATNGQVYISQNQYEEYQEILFYDITGRLIYQSNLSDQSIQSFDMGSYRGALIVKLKSSKKTISKKIIL